jgi:Flp pilus assembly pilin Flp
MARLVAWVEGAKAALEPEGGQTLVEYALTIGLTSMAAILVMITMGAPSRAYSRASRVHWAASRRDAAPSGLGQAHTAIMQRMVRVMSKDCQSGQTLVEYSLLLGLIALAAVVVLPLLFPPLHPGLETVIDTLRDVVG